MLIDDLLNNPMVAKTFGATWGQLQSDLQNSQKFVISKEIAEVADELSTDESQAEKVLQHCRLPFPLVWAEVVHQDRPHYLNAERPPAAHEKVPVRVGVLLRGIADTKGTQFRASLFWNYPDEKMAICSMIDMLIDVTKGVDGSVFMRPCPYWYDAAMLILQDHGQDRLAKLIECSKGDWPGEVPFWASILALVNSRNAIELKMVDNTLWNRKRAKRGQKPFVDYRVCHLRVPKALRNTIGVVGNEPGGKKAFHYVSGHFKVRKTGIYWWQPHSRGDISLGVVHRKHTIVEGADAPREDR